MNRSFDSKHLVFTTCTAFVDRESRYCSLLLFCVREINRFLEIPNRGTRKILRVSRNSNLDPRNSILETRASILDVRFSKTSRIEDRVSSRDCQLTFSRYCMFSQLAKRSTSQWFLEGAGKFSMVISPASATRVQC